jgi:hypothetical protein
MDGAPTIGSMIRFSWVKSREILFPFNFKRWIKVLIIVWLAAVGVQAIGMNFKMPPLPKPSAPKISLSKPGPVQLPQTLKMPVTPKVPEIPGSLAPETQAPSSSTEVSQGMPSAGESAPAMSKPLDVKRFAELKAKMERSKAKMGPLTAIFLIGVLASLGIGLGIFFMWISSRFNFVLLETLVKREPAIKEPFATHREAGNSFFKWSLAFWGILIALVILLGTALVGLLALAKGQPVFSIGAGVLIGLALVGIVVIMAFVGVIMRDLVLPIMYCEKIKAMEAMNRFRKATTFSWGRILQYLLMIFGFWILATIIQSIIGVLTAIGVLITGGILAIPGIILVKTLPFMAVPMIILGVILAIALILAVILVIGMAMLPVVMFFRVFALAYLTRLYPHCDLLRFQENG